MKGCPVKISIIVPVYNVEKQLSRCLNSCISQTLFDIEIICVNDGSTDNSQRILEEFAKRDYRISIVNKTNGGLSSARNAGLAVASGRIIMFLDSDDTIALNACERIWCEYLEGEFDILVFGSSWYPTIPSPDPWLKQRLTVQTHRINGGFKPEVLFMEPGAKPFVWRQAFSKAFLDKHKLTFDETVKYGEDTVFQMEAFPNAAEFSFIADPLYNYCWKRPGSLMATASKDFDDKLEKHLYLCEVITNYWHKKGWLKKYGDWYYDWLLDFIVPDIQNGAVQKPNVHLKRLGNLINQYDLNKPYYDLLNPVRKAYVDAVLAAVKQPVKQNAKQPVNRSVTIK